MAQLDPISHVANTIHDVLMGFADFAAIIQDSNFIRMTNPTTAFLTAAPTPANFPRVFLSQGGNTPYPWGTNSMVTSYMQTYSLIVITTNLVVTPLNAMKWAITRAFLNAGPDLGLSFVKLATLGKAVDAPAWPSMTTMPYFSYNQPRWVCTIPINVEMYFESTTLLTS